VSGWRAGPLGLVEATIRKFLADGSPQMAAALSFYTFFSLPPLIFLLLALTSTVLDGAVVQARLVAEVEGLIGPRGAEQVGTMIDAATGIETAGVAGAVVGIGVLLFGATGAFAQLQHALNRAWQVEPDPTRGGIRNFLIKRVFSFAMVVAFAFLLLVSLAISAFLSAFGGLVTAALPTDISAVVVGAVHAVISLVIITLLFALIYKVLPDAEIAWRDVWVGAVVTALLFEAGKWGIGLYMGGADPGTAYGAAGSLAIVLIWVYYSAMIVLGGAQFTYVRAQRRGRAVQPSPGAVRVVTERHRAPERPGAAE
jgi:membrane protein